METYDVVMLTVLIGATLFGVIKGLVWQLASLASIFVSYFNAYQFRDVLAGLLSVEAPWNTFLAMLILYLGTSLAIWLVFRLISDFIDRFKLREFDRQIGGLLGFVKGGLLCVIVTLFAVTLLGDNLRGTIVHSFSGRYIARLLHDADPIMPKEVKGILHPYVENLDRELQSPLPEGSASNDVPPPSPTPNFGSAPIFGSADPNNPAARWAERR